MAEPVHDTIARIRQVARQLNDVTDEAHKMVAAVELLLNEECSLGVPCEVEVRSFKHQDDNCDAAELLATTYLAYTRVNGKFQVAVNNVVERSSAEPGDGRERMSMEVRAWSSSSREEKLATFPKLPALLEKIACAAAEMIQAAEHAASSVDEMLNALNIRASEPARLPTTSTRRRGSMARSSVEQSPERIRATPFDR